MLKHADAVARGLMDIGQAAKESGVSLKMIRHYEAIGLMPKAARTSAGYRLYSANDVHTLRFIKRARHLGLPMRDIRDLLSLWQDRSRPCASVKKLARRHIGLLKARSQALSAMVEALDSMTRSSGSRAAEP